MRSKRGLVSRRSVRWGAAGALILMLGADGGIASGMTNAPAGSTSNTYTGCLSRLGFLSHVAIGTRPVGYCVSVGAYTETQVSWNEAGPAGRPARPVLLARPVPPAQSELLA